MKLIGLFAKDLLDYFSDEPLPSPITSFRIQLLSVQLPSTSLRSAQAAHVKCAEQNGIEMKQGEEKARNIPISSRAI